LEECLATAGAGLATSAFAAAIFTGGIVFSGHLGACMTEIRAVGIHKTF
jgi:hypothetical protein